MKHKLTIKQEASPSLSSVLIGLLASTDLISFLCYPLVNHPTQVPPPETKIPRYSTHQEEVANPLEKISFEVKASDQSPKKK